MFVLIEGVRDEVPLSPVDATPRIGCGLRCSRIAKREPENADRRRPLDTERRPRTLANVWGTRSHWMEKKFFEQNPGEATYRYSFPEEVAARDGCARIWLEMKAKDSRVNRYLDDLVTVHQAGFLREYTWTYFRDGSWSEPEGLRLAQFDQWRQVNLRGHELETKAIARFE